MKLKKLHSSKGLNIFSEIGNFCNIHNAINLAQNAPDFTIDPQLKNFLIESASVNFNDYASTSALPLLVENLIQFNAKREIALHLKENEISIIPGATYGLHIALQIVVSEGDEVILFEPCYDTYFPLIEMRKAKPIIVELDEHFRINWQLLNDVVTEKTTVIIVNSPNNPTGIVWKREDWEALWQIIRGKNIVVISDEVYDVLIYDDLPFYSAYHHPEIKNRCICLFSLEKMFHLSSWKCSYAVASPQFLKDFEQANQYICFTANIYAQYAFAKYLEIFEVKKNRLVFQHKRNLLINLLEDTPFTMDQPAGSGYAQCFNFKNYNSSISDRDFALLLIEKAKVATIPYSAFYHNEKNTGKLRISFAKSDDTLIQAAENLKKHFNV